MRQIIINSIVMGTTLGVSVYLLKHIIILLYYVIRYGGNYVKYYIAANIKKFDLCGYIVYRNSYIELKLKGKEIAGFVIGLTRNEKILIKTIAGDVIAYDANYIEDDDILTLKRPRFFTVA